MIRRAFVLTGAAAAALAIAAPPASANHYSDPCTWESAIRGTQNGDFLVGTSSSDVICGLGGNDTIYGAGGDDIIIGGSGADKLHGDGGYDRVVGDEYFASGSLAPTGICSGYDDWATGGADGDDVYGDCYRSYGDIGGTNGDDWLSGGDDWSGDFVVGDSSTYGSYPDGGNDNILGSYGNDDLYGDNYFNYYESSSATAQPTLIANGGDDYLDGRAGSSDYGDADGGYDYCPRVEYRYGCEVPQSNNYPG